MTKNSTKKHCSALPDILEIVPKRHTSARQRELQQALKSVPVMVMYRTVREPERLTDVDWNRYNGATIWRENGTLIVVECNDHINFLDTYGAELITFCLSKCGAWAVSFAVIGTNDSHVAETFCFLASLKQETNSFHDGHYHLSSKLSVQGLHHLGDGFTPTMLAKVLDANPERKLLLQGETLSPAMGTALASRDFQFDCNLVDVVFTDGGVSFVEAVKGRKSSFGGLRITFHHKMFPFTPQQFHELVHPVIPFATLDLYDMSPECAFIPFSANTAALTFRFRLGDMRQIALPSWLNIVSNGLTVSILADVRNWHGPMAELLGRFAACSHLESLRLSVSILSNHDGGMAEDDGEDDYDFGEFGEFGEFDSEDEVDIERLLSHSADTIARLVRNNPKLVVLDLGGFHWGFPYRVHHLEVIFRAMAAHPCLRKFSLSTYPVEDDPGYSLLHRLLRSNPLLVILDARHRVWGSRDDGILRRYGLCRWEFTTEVLANEKDVTVRSLLVATALLGRASRDFAFMRMLLSRHADALAELLQERANDLDGLDDRGANARFAPWVAPTSFTVDRKRKNEFE